MEPVTRFDPSSNELLPRGSESPPLSFPNFLPSSLTLHFHISPSPQSHPLIPIPLIPIPFIPTPFPSSPFPSSLLPSSPKQKRQQQRQRRQHKGRLQAGPYLVGLTGGIASGKSTVARLLCSLASSSSSPSSSSSTAPTAAAAAATAAVPIEPATSEEGVREGRHSEEGEAGQGRHSVEGEAGQGRQSGEGEAGQGRRWRVGAVDCDRLAHRAYEPGTPAYRRIVDLFGASVVRPTDGQIDRPALGAQVFSCPEKMAALTGVVWPMVRQIVEEEREAAGAGEWEVTFASSEEASTSPKITVKASTLSKPTAKGSISETHENSYTIRLVAPPADVLIVEAAMMAEAGSDRTVDEVWVVFVPEAEAKARLMERNGVTEGEAGKRIGAQMTSAARLAHADVAIYNGASEDATQRQLERAWCEVATQRAGPCLDEWRENFDADVAERWFHKLMLVKKGEKREEEGEWQRGEEGQETEEGQEAEERQEWRVQQVRVAGGWVAAVILSFQHLRRVLAAGREALQHFAVEAGLPQECLRHLFCFGLGYVAVALSSVLLTKGWRVSGTCRSQEDWHRLCHMGVQAHLLEDHGTASTLCLPQASLSALHSATHVLVSIPPLLSPRPTSPQHVDMVLSSCCEHLMQSARHRLRWIGYLSSTGVYGDWDGQWVDEDSPPRPLAPKAVARYAAEREWLAFQALLGESLSDAPMQNEAPTDALMWSEESWCHPEPSKCDDSAVAVVRVFRLGGIYGPFRSALNTAAAEMGSGNMPSPNWTAASNSTSSRRGESSYEEDSSVISIQVPCSNGDSRSTQSSSNSSSNGGESSSNGNVSSTNRERRQGKRFTSRCHVADICAAIGASMEGRGSSPIVNIVDDDPSPRRHVMQFAHQLIASGESDLYWQKLEALRATLPPGIIRRGGSGADLR
ncbi:unnamed protein product [Closterium sp. Naga37s-1]|nr:unnamed protein product [Closterium sp. Naga37s-1]